IALCKRHSLQACFSISKNKARSVILSREPPSESHPKGDSLKMDHGAWCPSV
uniref:Uncharacterized protein n=1 Tax=Piliocolobus tephrosceles TaxID=591936 RepID=A0A8C9GV84_9PRIM